MARWPVSRGQRWPERLLPSPERPLSSEQLSAPRNMVQWQRPLAKRSLLLVEQWEKVEPTPLAKAAR